MRWPDAHGEKAQDRLRAFGETAQIVEGLGWICCAPETALFGDHSEGEETRSRSKEGGKQGGSGQCVGIRIANGESERYGGVEDEIKADYVEFVLTGE